MVEKTIDHRLAWLAGIIDGEGWIGLGIDKTAGRGHHKHDSARWNIEICNTDYAILAEIISIATAIGVHSKYFHDRKLRDHRRKQQGRVSFRSRHACMTIIMATLPYLVGKRAQAELLLTAIHHRPLGYGRSVQARREWLPVQHDPTFVDMMKRMTTMNRRGTAPVGG